MNSSTIIQTEPLQLLSQSVEASGIDTVALANGGYAITWQEGGLPSSRYGAIRLQIIDANGAPVGAPITLEDGGTDPDIGGRAPSIDVLTNGDVVVAWSASQPSNTGAKYQLFDPSGMPKTGVMSANVVRDQTDFRFQAAVEALSSGGFALAFTGKLSTFSDTVLDVAGRFFDASGAALGSEFSLSGFSSQIKIQSNPRVLELPGGNLIWAWNVINTLERTFTEVFVKVTDGSGAVVKPIFRLGAFDGTTGSFALQPTADGGFSLVRGTSELVLGLFEPTVLTYDASGSFLDRSSSLLGTATSVDAAEDGLGGLVVTGKTRGLSFVQQVDANGQFVDDRFALKTDLGIADQTAVTRLSDGNFAFASAGIGGVYHGKLYPGDTSRFSDLSDTVTLADGGETVVALDGDDSVLGGAGNDVTSGGAGDDDLNGGAGNDTLLGDHGNDTIDGGNGDDLIFGARLSGFSNPESGFFAGLGDDAATNRLSGNSGNDTISGGGGIDFIYGGAGNDTIFGFDGNDRIEAGTGLDILYGGLGDDVLILRDGDTAFGAETLSGGGGDDRLLLSGGGGAVVADLSDHRIESIETVQFSTIAAGGDRTLILSSESFATNQSDPVLQVIGYNATGSTEVLRILSTPEPALRVDLSDVIFTNWGGQGERVEYVGSAQDDSVIGTTGVEAISGGSGNDTIEGLGSSDSLDGGDGIDTVSYSRSPSGGIVDLSADTAAGGDANGDTITGFENAIGSDHNDTLIGDDGDNTLSGLRGADTLIGGAGSDTFVMRVFDAVDTIRDFEPGIDRIDVSDWGRPLDFLDLAIVNHSGGGVEITDNPVSGNHRLIIERDGAPLTPQDFTPFDFVYAARSLNVNRFSFDGFLDSGNYGNGLDGSIDLDGIAKFRFRHSEDDLMLRFSGFDIDTDTELEVTLNGTSLGPVPAGKDNGEIVYRFAIDASQLVGDSSLDPWQLLTFRQTVDPAFAWGVTDLFLEPQEYLTPGVRNTNSYGRNFGRNFERVNERDGEVSFLFEGTGIDLTLAFNGFDIDFGDEVEVLLNNTSLGFLATGEDEAEVGYQLPLDANEQNPGLNLITFRQARDVNNVWGVTDILIDDPGVIRKGFLTSGGFGNAFRGSSDGDGEVSFQFTGSGQDLLLSFDAFDIDLDDELEVLLNGTSLGLLAAGQNKALVPYQVALGAMQQVIGENTLTFRQAIDPDFVWGVTDILIDDILHLDAGSIATGSFGNKFDGVTDADGEVSFTFTGSSAGVVGPLVANDRLLLFNGFDIDFDNELEVLLNGTSLGRMPAGLNDAEVPYALTLEAGQFDGGLNTLTFRQALDKGYTWGVTDVAIVDWGQLTIGSVEPGAAGRFGPVTDSDGVASFAFTGTGEDLILNLTALDSDFDGEIAVLLNGTVFDLIPAGVNSGDLDYQVNLGAAQQKLGTNVLSFQQTVNPRAFWAVSDVLLDTTGRLTVGSPEAAAFGHQFRGTMDADGEVSFLFTGTGEFMILDFTGYDIDFDDELEVLLNGTSLGLMAAGENERGVAYQLTLDPADMTLGDNTLTFRQAIDPGYIWGVTDLLLQEAPRLTQGIVITGSFGNGFNGTTNTNGAVPFVFEGTGQDLILGFNGFDIDFDTEVELLLNGDSLGPIAQGQDQAEVYYQVAIEATEQTLGTNFLTFQQALNPKNAWGVADILIDTSGRLNVGTQETSAFGNRFQGATDSDGVIAFEFTGTGRDLILDFTGFDIEFDAELAVFLNGTNLGPIPAGADNEAIAYQFALGAALQNIGNNTLVFRQALDRTFTWGVTDLLLQDVDRLTQGIVQTGSYGNGFQGRSDPDGEVSFVFEGTGQDLILGFNGFDVDKDDELEVLLNNTSLGLIPAGQDQAEVGYQLALDARDLRIGDNILAFRQAKDPGFVWGVTDILVDTSGRLSAGALESSAFGNCFQGATDSDGVIAFEFTGTGRDLILDFTGFDIEFDTELAVFLNGTNLGPIPAGADNESIDYQFALGAALQNIGDNTLVFRQALDRTFTWGVTDLLLQEADRLSLGLVETGSYGNGFGSTPASDGQARFVFDGMGQDLLLSFNGFDIDTDDELEVLLNNTSLGFVEAGTNLAEVGYQLTLDAADQRLGENVLIFQQAIDPGFLWGVRDILLDDVA